MKCKKHKSFKGDFGCPVCWLEEREQLQARVKELEEALEKYAIGNTAHAHDSKEEEQFCGVCNLQKILRKGEK